MSYLLSLTTLSTLTLLCASAQALYNSASKTNVAVYWGQGANQPGLLHFCQQPTIDIIPIGFVDVFPAQGNGYPGTNFGNQCWGGQYVYPGPGNNPSQNQLQSECPQMVADIPVCQSTYGTKIILSLGGGTNTYQLTSAADGQAFADFLWGAFGPQTSVWVASGKPRPFDGPNGQAVEVDGFDLDIEYASTDNSAGYIALINGLRNHFASATKQYIITGAPQCAVPDAIMGTMIQNAKFDALFIQYYNTPYCSARNWVQANPSYTIPGPEASSGFTFNAWVTFLQGTPSVNAKIYIGLPGSTTAAGDPSFFLSSSELTNLASAYYCKSNFGGLMVWEATAAETISGSPYYVVVKNALTGLSTNKALSCVAPSSSSTSISKTSSSTSTKSTLTTVTTSSSKISSTSKTSSSSITSTKSTLTTVTTSSSKISSTSKTSSSSITSSSKTSSTVPTSTKASTASSSNTKPLTSTSSVTRSTSTSKTSSTSPSSSKTSSTSKPLTTSTTLKTTTTSTLAPRATSSSPSVVASYYIPPDGSCGGSVGGHCSIGNCCSQWGWCGSSVVYCGVGCQKAFGNCA